MYVCIYCNFIVLVLNSKKFFTHFRLYKYLFKMNNSKRREDILSCNWIDLRTYCGKYIGDQSNFKILTKIFDRKFQDYEQLGKETLSLSEPTNIRKL